jgi:hypothetical protein
MSDTCKTETGSKFRIRKEWVRPELKQIGIEQITAHTSSGAVSDGQDNKHST